MSIFLNELFCNLLNLCMFFDNNIYFQAFLQARLGAFSSESDDGDNGIPKKKISIKKSVETINLIDDDDESDEENKNKNKNSERYINVFDKLFTLLLVLLT